MAIYLPQGGVELGQQILLGYWDGVNLYSLIYRSGEDGFTYEGYALQPCFIPGTGELMLELYTTETAVFTLGGSREAMLLQQVEPVEEGWLGGVRNQEGMVVAYNSKVSVALLPLQSAYQEWNDPTVLLAGVNYQWWYDISSDEQIPLSFPLLDRDGALIRWVNTCLVMPLSYYYGCSTNGGCYYSQSVNSLLKLSYCSLNGRLGVGNCTSVDEPGWTDPDDAAAGHVYVYCSSGKYCQTNCKAPCPEKKQECLYNGTTFICKATVDSIFSGEWWKEPWFIASVAALILVLVVVLVALIYNKKQKRKIEEVPPALQAPPSLPPSGVRRMNEMPATSAERALYSHLLM